jgi:predicted Zn-dependent protease
MLERLVGEGKADAFARYALALEYRRRRRTEDALAAFEALRTAHPDYLPMYLMAGQMLTEAASPREARAWLEQGVSLARKAGDQKALGELEDALSELE